MMIPPFPPTNFPNNVTVEGCVTIGKPMAGGSERQNVRNHDFLGLDAVKRLLAKEGRYQWVRVVGLTQPQSSHHLSAGRV
jgi:hypothetical protein